MEFMPIQAYQFTDKGKAVKFKKAISNVTDLNGRSHLKNIAVPAGAIGQIFSSRGLTMTIGFRKDFKTIEHHGFVNSNDYDYMIEVYNDFSSFDIEKG
jgi:hypothetical protein